MGFKNNFDEAKEFNGIKPEGDYECLISKVEERQTKVSQKTYLSVAYVVRNDVDQSYKNALIFQNFWKRKEPTDADKSVNGYSFNQIMSLGLAAGLQDGKEYSDLDDFCKDLIGRPVRVTIKHDEYNGNVTEQVSWTNKTKFPTVKHTAKDGTLAGKPVQYQPSNVNTTAPAVDIADDDLPF